MALSNTHLRPSGWIDLPCACANLRRLARLSTRLYQEELRACDIEVGQFTLLATIRRYPDLTQIELAHGLGIEPSAMRRNLAVLVRRRWVRKFGGADRRDRIFRLTAKGEKQFERARPYWYRAQERFHAIVGPETAGALAAALERAATALNPLEHTSEPEAVSA
jgi:DNA-binding MarR family transcriptional regulator